MESSPLSKISVLSISQRLKLRHRVVKSVRRVSGFSSGEMHVPCHLDGTLERSLPEMSSRTAPDVVLTHFLNCENLPTNRTICLSLFLMEKLFFFYFAKSIKYSESFSAGLGEMNVLEAHPIRRTLTMTVCQPQT